ncbi:MAG: DUF4870 domain-containing protein [Flavobacteriaceae bacterium]|nr:DUF4870 domain-containing protein [Flavobacteriaceae bacterium]
MKTSNERSLASLTHLSALSQFIFPFGNYIFPLIIWTSNKDKSDFVNHHGKQALNFQLSMLLYSLVFAVIAIPTFVIWLFNLINIAELNHNVLEFNNIISSQNITGMILVGFVAVLLFVILKLSEFFLVIYAAYKSADGYLYKYPFTINFIK